MAHDNARQEGAQDAKSFGISFAEWATDCILKEFGSGELGHPKEAKLSLKIFQSVTWRRGFDEGKKKKITKLMHA
jgi:hypothetical protein